MTPEQFCYWLQGYVEVHGAPPTKDQWFVVRDHLQEVFKKVTPRYELGLQPPVPMPGVDSQTQTPNWPQTTQQHYIC